MVPAQGIWALYLAFEPYVRLRWPQSMISGAVFSAAAFAILWWYAGTTVIRLVVILALAAYAFHTAVAGRPLFKAGFLESD